MRAFIAFDIPKEIKDYFLHLQKQLDAESARVVFPSDFHLTLKFLGDIPETKIEKIKEFLSKIPFEAFTAKLDGTGTFPSEQRINVFWVGIKPADKINSVQKAVDNALKDIFPPDSRFHPHITLARVKFIKDKNKFKESLKKIKIEPKEFKISSFKLIKSTLTKQGAVYEDIAEFKSQSL